MNSIFSKKSVASSLCNSMSVDNFTHFPSPGDIRNYLPDSSSSWFVFVYKPSFKDNSRFEGSSVCVIFDAVVFGLYSVVKRVGELKVVLLLVITESPDNLFPS